MAIVIDDTAVNSIIQDLKKINECLKSGGEIRTCLAGLVPLSAKFRGIIEFTTDPKTRFSSYFLLGQLSSIRAAYDGRSDTWYEVNKENVAEFRDHLIKYLHELTEALRNKNFESIVNVTADFFFNFHRLAMESSTDIRR